MIILLPNREWNQKQKHKKRLYQSPKTIFYVSYTMIRVRTKWLTFDMVSLLWADVKYHVPTGLVFRRRRAVLILLAMPPTSLERAALGLWCGRFKPRLEIRHAAALTAGAKHWHRQKAVFFMFLFQFPPVFIHWTVFISVPPVFIKNHGLPHIRNKSFS